MSQSPAGSAPSVMVKRGARLPIINVMRHLRVPNREVESVLVFLREADWLADGMRVVPAEDGSARLIPLAASAPVELSEPLRRFGIEMCEGAEDERFENDWWKLLAAEVGQECVEEHGEAWPSNHEFVGDMMILRIDEEVEEYEEAIARAKLASHPHIRLILADGGVQGEFRIRELRPIGVLIDGESWTGTGLAEVPEESLSTSVFVKESGRRIRCDPTRAYFSTKLQTERLETLALAKELRGVLGRPLRVCDPFCGVGPALATLLGEPGLVGDVLASDLNPDAVEMLFDNLRRWDRRDYPSEPSRLARIHDDRMVGVADATELAGNTTIAGDWDLVLVNLPHRTIEFLPTLAPLLDRTSPSMIRGRVVVAESEIDAANAAIRSALPPRLEGTPEPELRIKRDYSSTLRLCSFEAWIAPMP